MATTTTPAPRPAPPAPRRPTVTPGLRALWRWGGALFAVLLLGWGTLEVASLLAHEEEVVTTEFDAAELTSLDIGNATDTGVRVVGADVDRVRVTARISHGWRDTTTSARIEDGRLVLRASCPIVLSSHCHVGYTVEVPTDIDVRVRGDARLVVSDLDGDVDVSTNDGSVVAERLGGTTALRSDNGRVTGSELTAPSVDASSDNGRVTLGFDEAPDTVTARSDNGDVEVVVPDGEAYRVVTESDNGSVSAAVDQAQDSARTIAATTDNGDVTVRHAG